MRFLLMILMVATCLAAGVASASDVRVNFQPDRLSVSEEGMFLLTEEYGPVTLDNVHFDKGGLYTMCSVIVGCANSELGESSEIVSTVLQ